MRTLLFDVDGVGADFMGHLLKLLGVERTPTTFKFEDFLSKEETKQARALLKTPEFWLTLPVIPKAQEKIKLLKKKNDVVFVTRSYRACPLWWDCRLTWLEEHFDTKEENVICAARKELVQGDFFFDDRPDNVQAWEHKNHPNGRAYLFTQPYNAAVNRTARVTWDTIERVL